ncbi:MAG: NAD(P)/FAD-dependent oxidoreductase, partial [Pseudonocardia sp.]
GEDVYIVGGANSAGQAAVFFSRHAATVTLVVRGASLETSMSTYLIKQIEAIDNITVRTATQVVEAHGDDHLQSVCLREGDRTDSVKAGSMFVFIGAAPRTEWLDGVLLRDGRGFIPTGPDLVVDGQRPAGWTLDRDPYHLEASVPGIFVAGDVRADSVKRVASAVGEGAMAVTLVHRYLAEQ